MAKNTIKNPENTRNINKKESPDIIIEEIKPKCGFCFKEFSSFASLKVHVKNIHEGGNNKNYKCKFCEKVFGQSGSLKDHIVNVHQLQITGYEPEDINDGKFSGKFCVYIRIPILFCLYFKNDICSSKKPQNQIFFFLLTNFSLVIF